MIQTQAQMILSDRSLLVKWSMYSECRLLIVFGLCFCCCREKGILFFTINNFFFFLDLKQETNRLREESAIKEDRYRQEVVERDEFITELEQRELANAQEKNKLFAKITKLQEAKEQGQNSAEALETCTLNYPFFFFLTIISLLTRGGIHYS